MSNLRRIVAITIALCSLLAVSHSAVAQNKVVVVPLGDAEYKDPLNGARTLLFGAGELIATAPLNSAGISFSNTFNGMTCCAFLSIKKPLDWDGESDITVELFTQGEGTGVDSFFVRPRDYNDGDVFLDASGVETDDRDFTQAFQYREFTAILPAASLQKDWWYFVIQRATSSGTNTANITLVSVAVSYTAVQ